MALFFSVAICFSVASKQAEFNIVRTKNLAIENVFLQTEAIVYKWFQNAINNGMIVADFSSVPADNAIIELPGRMNKEIASVDKDYLIDCYIIDENYPTSFYLKAGQLSVSQNSPCYIYDNFDSGYFSKKYSIICEIKPKFNKTGVRYISCTEVIVFMYKGIFTINRLYVRRDYVLE